MFNFITLPPLSWNAINTNRTAPILFDERTLHKFPISWIRCHKKSSALATRSAEIGENRSCEHNA